MGLEEGVEGVGDGFGEDMGVWGRSAVGGLVMFGKEGEPGFEGCL